MHFAYCFFMEISLAPFSIQYSKRRKMDAEFGNRIKEKP